MNVPHSNRAPTLPLITKIHYPPAASMPGTICLLGGLFLAYTSYPEGVSPAGMAQIAAVYVAVAFLGSIYFDSRRGLYNLLRTDLLCIIGIYALTLLEFLFPQKGFAEMTTPLQTKLALNVVLIGIGALVIGRHLVAPTPVKSKWLRLEDLSNTAIYRIFLVAGFFAYFYMFLAVQFDPLAVIQAMLGPRFSEPWGRGALGDWKALLNELGMMGYIIPPLTGMIWNRRSSFSKGQLITVAAIFAFTIFHGFSSGTRNIFIAYLSTFLMGYLITLKKHTLMNTILPILLATVIGGVGSYHMLGFRTMGLQSYLTNRYYAIEKPNDTLAVDYNLASIGKIADALPRNHEFLGLEVLYWSLVKPVPRAMWPEKPVGLSVSIEKIMGAEGYTVAATYLGESYMMGGMFGVIGMSMFFGAVAAWWNRMAMQQQSDYALVVYALGFFAAGLTMRSMFWFTTAILPVVAMIVFRRFKFLK
jgi:hypothetical protein